MSVGQVMTVLAAMLLIVGVLWFTSHVETSLSASEDAPQRFSAPPRG